jgi:hypothetical protein
MLRGWLQDTVSEQWTDVQLNKYLRYALRETEKVILAVDPEAFKCTYYADIRVGSTGQDAVYTYPAGTWGVLEIATSTDGTTYSKLRRLSLPVTREFRNEAGFVPWDKRHFMLYPTPDTAVTNGLRAIVAPTLVMTDDTDDNPLPEAFETMHLKIAQQIALADTGEPTDKLQAEIQALKTETPRFYFTSGDPSFLTPTGYEG